MKPARPLIGIAVLAAALLPAPGALSLAPPEANEDESKIPPYTLPDPLVLADGRKVADARTWREKRRPELLRLFETHVYGRTPAGGASWNCSGAILTGDFLSRMSFLIHSLFLF